MVAFIPKPMTAVPLTTGKALLAYLPQRPPIVLVDTLWQADDNQAQASLTITPSTLFVQEGQFQVPGLLENMAQTAAVRAGWLAAQNNTIPPLGYVAAIRYTTIHALPKVGNILTTTIYCNYQTESFLIFRGFVYVKEQLMIEGEFTIVFAPSTS